MTAPSFAAAAAAAPTEDAPLASVRVDGAVLLKICAHVVDRAPAVVTGQLLGLDVGSTLEVTEAFPFPSRADADPGDDDDGLQYQVDMMRCLREVNVDNNTVGWYQTAVMGAYQTLDLVDTFAAYSASIARCVCLVVDPDAAAAGAGGACLRAVKLSDAFLAAHRKAGGSAAGLGGAALAAAGVTWRDVFVELPVSVHASPLALALARSLLTLPADGGGAPAAALDAGDAARLALGAPAAATRTVEHVADCLDDLGAEAARLSQYHRALLRAQQAAAAFAAKRRQENAARRAAGEPPLPEEDPSIGRPPAEPSPVDGFLITAQVAACCDRLGTLAGGALQKLALFEALERAV